MRCAWLVVLAVGCYTAPDYSGTHFKCDDEHACPDGQPCIDGVCAGSGGSGSGSGSGSGMVDAPTSPVAGVQCGATVCTSTQKCCADFINGPICIALNAQCAGFAATCDGTEDCGGSPCCDLGGQVIACGTSCQTQICVDNADCTGGMTCCPSIGTGEPWGRCYPFCP